MANTLNDKSKTNTRSKKNQQDTNESDSLIRCSTPTPKKNSHNNQLGTDYSPVFLPYTQESLEDVDVLWDWNSPQSKVCYTRKKKLAQKAPSPKLPLKKHNSNNQLKTFEKLKEELRAFKNEIKIPKMEELNFDDNDITYDNNKNELDDMFNDSIDEQFQIEEKFVPIVTTRTENNSPLNSKAKGSPRNLLTKSFSSNTLETGSPIKRSEATKPSNFKSKMQQMKNEGFDLNDSLDNTLYGIDINELLKKSSSKQDESNNVLKFKTKSLSFGDHYANTRRNIQKDADAKNKEQIEKKRLDALAKLRLKKKQEFSDSDTSPIKCSPEEIELKRKQALAKLEAKKKQEIIERNRLEALKRLEFNRKKRAANSLELSQKNNMR